MKTILAATSVAFVLASGLALAQTEPAPVTDPGAADKQFTISDPKAMAPFFTDETMTTMRSADEVKAAWAALTDEQKTAATEQCKDATIVGDRLKDFCGQVGGM